MVHLRWANKVKGENHQRKEEIEILTLLNIPSESNKNLPPLTLFSIGWKNERRESGWSLWVRENYGDREEHWERREEGEGIGTICIQSVYDQFPDYTNTDGTVQLDQIIFWHSSANPPPLFLTIGSRFTRLASYIIHTYYTSISLRLVSRWNRNL